MSLTLKYEPLDKMLQSRYEFNAKAHDIGALMMSITQHGFRDPIGWDNTLNAIIDGNGRTEALWQLYLQWTKDVAAIPAGIQVNDGGMWEIPVISGVDAIDVKAAIAFLIDVNNLTMMGGDFTALDMSRAWDDNYLALLQQSLGKTISVDENDYLLMLKLRDNPVDIHEPETLTDTEPREVEFYYLKIPFTDETDRNEVEAILKTIPVREQGELILGLLNDYN